MSRGRAQIGLSKLLLGVTSRLRSESPKKAKQKRKVVTSPVYNTYDLESRHGRHRMNIGRVVVVLFALLASGHTQASPDFYIASLQMPCYPPLARRAKVQGQVKVRVEVGKD